MYVLRKEGGCIQSEIATCAALKPFLPDRNRPEAAFDSGSEVNVGGGDTFNGTSLRQPIKEQSKCLRLLTL